VQRVYTGKYVNKMQLSVYAVSHMRCLMNTSVPTKSQSTLKHWTLLINWCRRIPKTGMKQNLFENSKTIISGTWRVLHVLRDCERFPHWAHCCRCWCRVRTTTVLPQARFVKPVLSSFLIRSFSVQFAWCKTFHQENERTGGYATWFMAGIAIRIAHYDVITRKV